jgi:Leucine-rich repeat (LRR) protein
MSFFAGLDLSARESDAADGGVPINDTSFPDDNFRNWLLDANNLNGVGSDGTLTAGEIAKVTQIDVRGQGISDLTGIENFTRLTSLHCSRNQLTSLPALPNSLEYLDCNSNQLTSLPDLSTTVLTDLYCDSNQLTSLPDLPTSLTTLYCSSNQLTSLPNLPTSLITLQCTSNQLTSLPDLSTTVLTTLRAYP